MKLDTPLEPPLVEELFAFWEPIFGGPIDVTRETLFGNDSLITVHVRRRDGRLVGACLLARSRSSPSLGALGEVATDPNARRGGIASTLSRQARDDFAGRGGQAIFLGTVNPGAARIYHRLGWRKLAGANLMLNVLKENQSPGEFMEDYFRGIGAVQIREPSPDDRVPMIPLLISPRDWRMLDSNVGMLSTRYAVQDSCLGLYRRYSALSENGRGAWFCASDERGRLAGLSTARLDRSGGCQVDGFARLEKMDSWRGLIQKASDWASNREARPVWARVSVEDEEKMSLFESLGFKTAGPGEPFDLGGRDMSTMRLELA